MLPLNPRRNANIAVILLLFFFLSAPFLFLRAQAEGTSFKRVGALALDPAPITHISSGVFDHEAGYAYFGSAYNIAPTSSEPGRIMKVALGSDGDPSRIVGTLVLPSSQLFVDAVIDPTAGYAYFVTGTGRIQKIALGEGDELPTLVATTIISSTQGGIGITSAVIDADAGYAWFASSRTVIKVALGEGDAPPVVVSHTQLPVDDSGIDCAVLDKSRGLIFLGAGSGPPRVIKVAVGEGDAPPVRIGATLVQQGTSRLATAQVDPDNGHIYFGTTGSPAEVVKVAMGEPDGPPQFLHRITLATGENMVSSSTMDTTNGHLLLGTYTSPARVVKVALGFGGATPQRIGVLTLEASEDNMVVGLRDPDSGDSWFASYKSASQAAYIVRVAPGEVGEPPVRTESLRIGPGDNILGTALIEPDSGHAYFTTSGLPSRVLKIGLGEGDTLPTRNSAVDLELSDGFPVSAIINSQTGYAWYGTSTSPGRVVKVALGNGNDPPVRAGAIEMNPGESELRTAVINPLTGYALFATATTPTRIIKVNLGVADDFPSRVSSLELPPDESGIASAIIDPTTGHAWFSSSTSPPRVIKVDMGHEDQPPTRIGSASLGSNNLRVALIDNDAGIGYYGNYAGGTSSILSKAQLGSGMELPELLGFAKTPSDTAFGERYQLSGIIDPARRRAWLGTQGPPGRIIEYDLGAGLEPPTHRSALTLEEGEEDLRVAVIDGNGGYAYFGTWTRPARIVKVRLGEGHNPLAPANDDFPGQSLETVYGGLDSSTSQSSRQAGEPVHDGHDDYGSVWYSWTAPYSAHVEFSICGGDDVGRTMAAYTGDYVAALAPVEVSAQTCPNATSIDFEANLGTTYRIAVAETTANPSQFVLDWALAPAVVLDPFVGDPWVPESTTEFIFEGTTLGEPTEVQWRVGTESEWQAASGTPQAWTFAAPLAVGDNIIQIRAHRFGTSFSEIVERVITRRNFAAAPLWSATLRTPSRAEAKAVATDADGNVYVVGDTTGLLSADWEMDALLPHGADDGFIIKFNSLGVYQWHRYIGGAQAELSRDVAVDSSGNIYVVGFGSSNPFEGVTFGSSSRRTARQPSGYLLKLDPTGETVWVDPIYPDYIAYGESYSSQASSVAIANDDDIVIAGHLMGEPQEADTSTTGYYQTPGVAFVSRYSTDGTELWRTYLGGDDFDRAHAVAVDQQDNIIVAGVTRSTGWTTGGWDTAFNGGNDAFVAKLTPNGEVIWSSYLGGEFDETAFGVDVDNNGNIAITGWTNSDYWVSKGANTIHEGWLDAFVVLLNADGQHLWSTYLGGRGEDIGHEIAFDANGFIYITGQTSSDDWARRGWNTSYTPALSNSFIAKFNPTGQHLWSSYITGAWRNQARGIALDDNGGIIIAGTTEEGQIGWREALILKIAQDFAAPPPTLTILDPATDEELPYETNTRLVSGTASAPDSELAAIEWRIGNGDWKNASGAESWNFLAQNLQVGDNSIIVRPLNAQGSYGLEVGRTLTRLPGIPALGDLNDDLIVNVVDVTILANLIANGQLPPLQVADINGDEVIDQADVQALAELIVE